MQRDALRSLGIINRIKTGIYGLTKTSTEVFRREIGSPDRSRTCIYRFIPATAFAAALERLWSGLSLSHGPVDAER